MTRAITSYQAFGVYRDEALTKRAFQFLRLVGTAANTDTAFDLGTYAGSFWSEADDDATGLAALKVIKDIQTRAAQFLSVSGLGVNGKSLAGATLVKISGTVASGSATPAVTATGLLTTDTILAVTQRVQGANNLPLLGWSAQVADGITAAYSADPGANGVLDIAVSREGGLPNDGQVKLAMNGTNTKLPDLTYKSGDAPTSFDLVLCWLLNPGEQPVFTES